MPKTQTTVIFYDAAKIMFVLVPKCGSTTLLTIFANLVGFSSSGDRARSEVTRVIADGRLQDQGLSLVKAEDNDALVKLRNDKQDYLLLASVRDPYARALSSYNNKLYRYAKRFDKRCYLTGKLKTFLRRPWSAPDGFEIQDHVRERISFDRFISGLERNGIDFDPHFTAQCDLLALDRLRYDRMIRLESFEDDLFAAMAFAKLPNEALERLDRIPRSNATNGSGAKTKMLSDELRARIANLYSRDFERLGYPR